MADLWSEEDAERRPLSLRVRQRMYLPKLSWSTSLPDRPQLQALALAMLENSTQGVADGLIHELAQ